MTKKKITVLITDLDNTLYDWFGIWYRCFRPMLDEIVRISGVAEQQLIEEIAAVHRRYGTSEYAFLIEELPSVVEKHGTADLARTYHSAIEAYRKNRRRHLKLYPTVARTLARIKQKGSLIVAYTESKKFYTNYRIRKLGLDGVIDVVYSPKDHPLPANLARMYPRETYGLAVTADRHTPENELKPNPGVLLDIIRDVGAPRDRVLYVGDSLGKDIRMAQDAGVMDVHAKYGQSRDRREYELLRKVTHWPPETVREEASATESDVVPTVTLERRFSEITKYFEFRPFERT